MSGFAIGWQWKSLPPKLGSLICQRRRSVVSFDVWLSMRQKTEIVLNSSKKSVGLLIFCLLKRYFTKALKGCNHASYFKTT